MTEWTNSAVGRFCYKSPLTVYLLDGSGKTAYSYTDTEFDARTFVQGEVTDIYTAFTLPQDLAAGTYKLAVAITDENGEPLYRARAGGADRRQQDLRAGRDRCQAGRQNENGRHKDELRLRGRI